MMFYATMPVLVERSLQVEQGSDALLQSFKLMKLKSPARLGDVLELSSTGNGKVECVTQNSDVIFTATKALLASGVFNHQVTETEEVVGQHTSNFSLFPDEVGGGLVSTRTIFNLFERGRTDVLGGPSQLAAAQSSNNHVYVARISNYNRRRSQQGSGGLLRPRSAQVVSQTEPVGNSIVEFTQFCVVDGVLLASAKITCCSVDAKTGLPAPFGQILRDKLFPPGTFNL